MSFGSGGNPIKLKPKQKAKVLLDMLSILLGRPRNSVKQDMWNNKLTPKSEEDVAMYIDMKKKKIRFTPNED